MLVKDIMTKSVLTVGPDDSLKEAIDLLFSNNFNGLPVVNEDGQAIGIITEYDLIAKDSDIHLPTLLALLKKISVYTQDKKVFKDQFKRLFSLKVQDIMNINPMTIPVNYPVSEVVKIFIEHHKVNPLLVVDRNQKLLGIVSRYDVLKLYYQRNWDPFLQEVAKGKREVGDMSSRVFEKEIKQLGKKYTLVTKTRSRFWFVFSILFLFVGLIIAFALMLRIVIK